VSIDDGADSGVVLEHEPSVGRVWICELRDLTLPVADRVSSIHEVDKDLVHFRDAVEHALELLHVEAFAPPVVASALALFRGARLDFDVPNHDFDSVLVGRGKTNSHANFSDDLVILLNEHACIDGSLFDGLLKSLFTSLWVLAIFGLNLHKQTTLPGGCELWVVVHNCRCRVVVACWAAIDVLPVKVAAFSLSLLDKLLETEEHGANLLVAKPVLIKGLQDHSV